MKIRLNSKCSLEILVDDLSVAASGTCTAILVREQVWVKCIHHYNRTAYGQIGIPIQRKRNKRDFMKLIQGTPLSFLNLIDLITGLTISLEN